MLTLHVTSTPCHFLHDGRGLDRSILCMVKVLFGIGKALLLGHCSRVMSALNSSSGSKGLIRTYGSLENVLIYLLSKHSMLD